MVFHAEYLLLGLKQVHVWTRYTVTLCCALLIVHEYLVRVLYEIKRKFKLLLFNWVRMYVIKVIFDRF